MTNPSKWKPATINEEWSPPGNSTIAAIELDGIEVIVAGQWPRDDRRVMELRNKILGILNGEL